ncbi:MAG: thymidylate synthase [Candidatus Pacearchaeota archaeon]
MTDVNQADVQYQELLERILTQGEYEWNERTQTGTLSKFGDQMDLKLGSGSSKAQKAYSMEHDLSQGFPILTTKKMAPRIPFEEMLFFLRGENDLKSLIDKNVNIWNDNGFDFYLRRHGLEKEIPKHTKKWDIERDRYIAKVANGDLPLEERSLGRIYGVQWRDWRTTNGTPNNMFEKAIEKLVSPFGFAKVKHTDQLAEMINKLKHGDRTSRSNIVTAQNLGEKNDMALPPCHLEYQTRVVEDKNRLDLRLDQRSCDTILGVPFNMAQYGLLLNMLAHETGLNPGYFEHMLGNVHFYTGVGERQEFLRDQRNLHELQKGVKKARDSQDYMEMFNWYMNSAPEEPENRKGYDHVPFALIQLAREPKQSSQLEFKVSEDTSFWDMINMRKEDLAKINNYEDQGKLQYEWNAEKIKPQMAA